jgi:hypothetical protein
MVRGYTAEVQTQRRAIVMAQFTSGWNCTVCYAGRLLRIRNCLEQCLPSRSGISKTVQRGWQGIKNYRE